MVKVPRPRPGKPPAPPPGKPPAAKLKEEPPEEEYHHEEYGSKRNWAKWRTEPCKWAKNGKCKFGEHCWFIH